jgi:hypothetical protein
MPVSDAQVRKLMEEMSKHGRIGVAAMKADMDPKTARKYVTAGKLPSEMRAPRDWRTRQDPFEEHWPEVTEMLHAAPALEAKTIFEHLSEKYPGRYEPGQLRTVRADWLIRDLSDGERLPPASASPMSNAFSSYHLQRQRGSIARCSTGSVRTLAV